MSSSERAFSNEYAIGALRNITIANGAAVVALLSFIGTAFETLIEVKMLDQFMKSVEIPLYFFLGGGGMAVLAGALASLGLYNNSSVLQFLAWLCGALSGGAFILGCFGVFDAFTTIQHAALPIRN